MRRAGKITAAARALAGEMVRPGVTTQEIDKAVYHFITVRRAPSPSFLHYQRLSGQRAASPSTTRSSTASPGTRVLKEGDIVSVDVGAYIGRVPRRLRSHLSPAARFPRRHSGCIDVTRQSFFEGLALCQGGHTASPDISHAVQSVCGGERLLRRARVCRPWRRQQHARGARGAQLRGSGPRAAAAARA